MIRLDRARSKMAPTTIRKAIGAVKDQTSIGLAKVASNMAPELEVAIVKATSHDDDPAGEKYIREILNLTSYSRGYVSAAVSAVSKRLGKTRDWIVALKALTLIHRLLSDGDPLFREEFLYATRRGTRLLNLTDFRDEAHSSSWDHSAFVRTYALYLDQRLEMLSFERKNGGGGSGEDRLRSPPRRPNEYEYGDYGGSRNGDYGGSRNGDFGGMRRSRSYGDVGESSGQRAEEGKKANVTPLREMKPEKIFTKMGHMQRLLDRFLSCRPTGLAKNNRLVLIALYPIVRESFQLYADVCEVLAVLLDKFFDMEYPDCVKTFEAYASSAKQIDELVALYSWCKETGVARSSEYPEVQKITGKLLETLEEFVRDRSKRPKSPEKREALPAPPLPEEDEAEPIQDMNEIRALPAPETQAPPPPPEPAPKPQAPPPDLVDLREDPAAGDAQGNQLALALFAGPAANGNGSWEAFPSGGGSSEVTSAWQNPAAEVGKADWELALVETASNLGRQKAEMGGGIDPLLLNGMYDQGAVRQHTSAAQMGGGSASSVAVGVAGRGGTGVLALPAPDGTVVAVNSDPFAASIGVPPPAYVQMADMEKKQGMLVQEQVVWQQYAREGMQGQSSLTKINGVGYNNALPQAPFYHQQQQPYGMPPPGYYHAPY